MENLNGGHCREKFICSKLGAKSFRHGSEDINFVSTKKVIWDKTFQSEGFKEIFLQNVVPRDFVIRDFCSP